MLLPRPVANGLKVYKSLFTNDGFAKCQIQTRCWEACYTLPNPHFAYFEIFSNFCRWNSSSFAIGQKITGHFTQRLTWNLCRYLAVYEVRYRNMAVRRAEGAVYDLSAAWRYTDANGLQGPSANVLLNAHISNLPFDNPPTYLCVIYF